MVKINKIVAIVQARCNSVRLPGKVMKKIVGTPAIELLYKRLKRSKKIDNIVIATSLNQSNKKLTNFLKIKKINFFAGEEDNVLKRYYKAAKKYNADIVIRITGDSVLIDAELVDKLIKIFLNKKVDYVSNCLPPSFPDGLDIEIFTIKALKTAYKNAKGNYDKEHVTPFIRRSDVFKKFNVRNHIDLSNLRWSLDEQEDFDVIKSIFNYYKPKIHFSWQNIYKLVSRYPNKYKTNSFIPRNEGAVMTKSQKLWKRAKRIIPGGNMLLSKRPELFLPNRWPTYYKKAKDCLIWDLDGKKYFDVSLMGIGTNILGYSNPEVDRAVKKAISNGNMSTLNCPDEVELSEKLLAMHPWAEMVRLARTGGEASAIAVRIARAASGKSKVAFCGYHGWHDWYLSANLKDKNNLKNHLMAGLEPNGVPISLKNTSFPFSYNCFEELEKIVKEHDIGVVKMEVSRNQKPKNNFLKKIRKLCDKKNIVLIFDECSSGFRQTFGGLHKIYGVNPDIAWFGKALGNGYGITAIIGKKKVMNYAQDSFISSTFWTERSGPAAANKTLEIMEKTKSWKIITKIGENIQKNWKKIAIRNKLHIQISGIPALSSFSILSDDWLKYKTFISQEMLKKNFLATNAIFASVKHSNVILDQYYDLLDDIFNKISKFEQKTKSVDRELEVPVCHSGFRRLN